MMQGAAAVMRSIKPVDKEVALASAYKLDGSLPIDLRKWTNKKQSRAYGGIPMEKNLVKATFSNRNPGEVMAEKLMQEKEEIEAVFKDTKTNLASKEKFAQSILAGDYEASPIRRPGSTRSTSMGAGPEHEYENGHLVKHQFEKDLIRGTGRLHRARMKPEAFLAATGTQAPIIIVEPRMVMLYEMEKNVARVKTPGAGKEGRTFTFAGKYVDEEVKTLSIANSKQELDRIMSSKFVTDKKKMWEHSRNLHLQRGRAEKKAVIAQATLNKKQQSEMIVTNQERKKYIDEFRSKLKDHLVLTRDPLIGTIMRYVNEKIAWDILQQYKGYSMSMKAIVGLVGQTLGDLELDEAEYAGDAHLASIDAEQDSKYISMDFVQSYGQSHVEVPSPKSLTHSTRHSLDGFEGENVYLTGVPSGPEEREQDENGDRVMHARQVEALTPNIPTTDSINDSIQETIEDLSSAGDGSFVVNNRNRIMKPNASGGKYLASQNLFAPKGANLAEKLLPHHNDLAVQRLGSLHAARGSTPGSPNNMRTRILLPDKTETLAPVMPNDPAVQLHSVKWNSDDFEPVNPLDKLTIDRSTGGIINVNAWHTNPGSRGNTPSASGVKGWNANTPVARKMAGGFVVSVVDGRDAFYGGTKDGEHPDAKLSRLNSPDRARRPEQQAAAIMPSSFADVELYRSMSTIDSTNFAQYEGAMRHEAIQHAYPGSAKRDEVAPERPLTEESMNNVLKLIEAIDIEKKALGTKPSMQPEIVIGKDHLDQLGTGQISIDTIATQIRWAKEKRVREMQKHSSQESLSRSAKPSTSQSMGDLNYMTSSLDPIGGVGIQVNQFANMDVELGFKPHPADKPDSRGAPNDSLPGSPNLSRHPSTNFFARAESASIFSIDNPNEIKRLVDANIRAPPRQLKSLAKPWEPNNPYKSLDEMTCIINYGVAAGSGLNLAMTDEMRKAKLTKWGQRVKTREGRFRTGGTSDVLNHGFSPDNREHINEKKKKISKMLP